MDKFTSKQFHMTNRKPTSTLTQEWIKTGHNTKFSIDGEEGFQPDSLKTTYCSARELMEWLGQKVYEEDYIQDELGQIYEWDKHVINLNNIRVFYLCEGRLRTSNLGLMKTLHFSSIRKFHVARKDIVFE